MRDVEKPKHELTTFLIAEIPFFLQVKQAKLVFFVKERKCQSSQISCPVQHNSNH